MKKAYSYVLISFLILIFPVLAFADGGMIPWPPEVELDQSAQNAIIGWNGEEEIIILSIDLESSVSATVLRIIPLPSNPSEIKEGSFGSFERLVELMNEKLDRGDWKYLGDEEAMAPGGEDGVEIVFQEQIGAHDITVVKVNDLDYFLDWVKDFTEEKGFSTTYELECEKYHYSTCPEGCIKQCISSHCSPDGVCTSDCDGPGSCSGGKVEKHKISSEFREGVKNYLKKDLKYFVFDVIETGPQKESVKPLIYRFENDFLYYPILISGISEISESTTKLNLFLVTKQEVDLAYIPYSYYSNSWFSDYTIELTENELREVSEDLSDLFEGEANVIQGYIYRRLGDLANDLIMFPSYLWDKNLTTGSQGREVKALQQILINDGFWESEAEATGYFGSVTKQALARFQDEYKRDILYPVDLEKGTGYFGSQTRDYFKSISLLAESVEPEKATFNRNLSLGMSGDDVKALQEILIDEGVWDRSDVGATGYFGSITKTAVIKYQKKYAAEILEPLGLVEGTGFVGSSTRAHLER